MQEITLSLPDSAKEFVDAEIGSGQHANASEVFAHLVQMEQKRRALEVLKNLVREAEESGPPEEVTPAFWEEMRNRIREKSARREEAS
jgi:antitoxin ParD1/3/4